MISIIEFLSTPNLYVGKNVKHLSKKFKQNLKHKSLRGKSGEYIRKTTIFKSNTRIKTT